MTTPLKLPTANSWHVLIGTDTYNYVGIIWYAMQEPHMKLWARREPAGAGRPGLTVGSCLVI